MSNDPCDSGRAALPTPVPEDEEDPAWSPDIAKLLRDQLDELRNEAESRAEPDDPSPAQ